MTITYSWFPGRNQWPLAQCKGKWNGCSFIMSRLLYCSHWTLEGLDAAAFTLSPMTQWPQNMCIYQSSCASASLIGSLCEWKNICLWKPICGWKFNPVLVLNPRPIAQGKEEGRNGIFTMSCSPYYQPLTSGRMEGPIVAAILLSHITYCLNVFLEFKFPFFSW